jgi:hypothetical protein
MPPESNTSKIYDTTTSDAEVNTIDAMMRNDSNNGTTTKRNNNDNNNEDDDDKKKKKPVHNSTAESCEKPPSKPDIDPEEILQASLEFEHSRNNSQQRRQHSSQLLPGVDNAHRHNIIMRLRERPKSASTSSSSSLYPSLNSVEDFDFDAVEVERSWENAAAAASSKTKKKKNSTGRGTSSATNSAASASYNSVSSDDRGLEDEYHNQTRYPLSYSGFNLFDGNGLTDTGRASLGVAAVAFPESNNGLSSPAPESTACARIPDDDFNVPYIPSEPCSYNADDDMIALKVAAAYGQCCTVIPEESTAAATSNTSSNNNDQTRGIVVECAATVVDYGMVHHLAGEDSSSVQAEFVREQNPYEQQEQEWLEQQQQQQQRLEEQYHSINNASNAGDTPTEATVIESGPVDKAAFSADTMEAVVLQQEEGEGSYGSIVDLDTKPPAIPVVHEDSIGIVPLEYQLEDDGNAHYVDPLSRASAQTNELIQDEHADAIATVVDYDVHPSEMTAGSVQAEFVGRSSIEVASDRQRNLVVENIARAENIVQASEVDREATEATVVDSGPIEKATAEAWSTGAAEEAVVIGENHSNSNNTTNPSTLDDALPIIPTSTGREAEIVEIHEDVHPAELESENAATAELVGSDSHCAFAVEATSTTNDAYPVTSSSVHDETIVVGDATAEAIIVEDQASSLIPTPREAGATVVLAEDFDTNDRYPRVAFIHQSSSVSTIQDPSHNTVDTAVETMQPATAVAVLQVEDSTNRTSTNNEFYDYPQKPSIAHRAVSEPVRTSNTSQNDSLPIDTCATANVVAPAIPMAIRIDQIEESSSSAPPAIPRPSSPLPTTSSASRADSVGSGGRRECHGHAVHALTNNIARGTSNVMEMLFGNTRTGIARKPISFEMDSLTASVLPRTLLPSSVIFSEATNSWVATVNTNQKALDRNNVEESSKALRAFSVPTKKQAICLARAWSPPRMHPFDSNPNCFICESQFVVFRRACHCRNCGVCVCSSCSTQWPSKMLPTTYNIKREGIINVCKACDWLCSAFRLALINGDYDKAIALYETGNLNLTTPFANVKGELL